MAKQIKLMAEYTADVPLWWADGEQVGFVNPVTLGLSDQLVGQLRAWNLRYRALLNRQDPASTPDMAVDDQRQFEAEGHRLARDLATFLGSTCKVQYFSQVERRLLEF